MDPTRLQVIENIKANIAAGEFNNKVEPGDPTLDEEQTRRMLYKIVKHRESISYGLKNFVSLVIAFVGTTIFNKETVIEGMPKITGIRGAAIVTSNHFAPLENTIIRYMVRRNRKGRLFAVSQDTNFAMKGFFGFLLKYADLIPVSKDQGYMSTFFSPMLEDALADGHYVLIYPEQEMWWNYRKPRPLKRGAYHYAAKFGVPVISCFTEIIEKPELDKNGMHKLRYVLHILDPIFPDPSLSPKENSSIMMEKDYAQKKAAYEKAYGKELDYTFDMWDIAGVVPEE